MGKATAPYLHEAGIPTLLTETSEEPFVLINDRWNQFQRQRDVKGQRKQAKGPASLPSPPMLFPSDH